MELKDKTEREKIEEENKDNTEEVPQPADEENPDNGET